MRKYAAVFVLSIGFVMLAAALAAQTRTPKTHRLEATPSTVAYGYYWAEARPVLRIASGDIIDVDTLLTNTPTGLQRAGVSPEKIQDSLKAIVAEVTGDRRGPGGHILTGPVYVEAAGPARGQSRQPRARRRHDPLHSGVRARRALRDRRRPRGAGRRRSGSDGGRDVAARPRAAHRAQ